MGNIKEKIQALWRDQRSWKVRFPLAALCAFTCVFTFILFGPCEIYIQNMQDMTFSFHTLLPVLLLAGGTAFAALLTVLLLLRGRLFNYAVTLLFAVTLAGYLQGNLLNVNHGTLDGSSVAWSNYQWPMLKNLAVWLAILAAAFTLLYLSRKLWTRAVEFISLLLAAVQTVALVGLIFSANFSGLQDKYLSTAGMFDLSSNHNVVVFLLDRCDRSYLDSVLDQHPEWQEKLGGFVSYHDFTGSFSRTYASVAYLLTGVKDEDAFPFHIPQNDYLSRAWERSTLLPQIREAGYQVGLYSHIGDVVGNMDNLEGKIDNIGLEAVNINRKVMLKKMLELSAYRYLPEAVKPYFQLYTGDLDAVQSVGQKDLYQIDDPGFWERYQEQGLRKDADISGCFRFYHLQGAHFPFNMNELAQRVDTGWDPADRLAQVTGNMAMIFQYLDELQAQGLYDNTTVVITTDHAADYPDWPTPLSTLDGPRLLPLLVKPAHADLDQPLQISRKQICQDNLRASLAGWCGLDTRQYGRTIESVGEDEPMTRIFWMLLYDEALETRDAYMGTYEIHGDGNDFSNWELLEMTPLDSPGW